MNRLRYILVILSLLVAGTQVWAQVDRSDVRRGNRDFKKGNYREADIDYRKALVKDSLSVAANYNLASNLYRQKDMEQAKTTLERIGEIAPGMDIIISVMWLSLSRIGRVLWMLSRNRF